MQDNQDIYLSILDQIDDVFYRTDKEGRLIMGSSSSVRVLGCDSMDEILGKPFNTWSADPQEGARFEEEMKQNGGIDHIEMTLRKKDGTLIYTEGSCHYYYDDDGNPLGVEGVWRDITERKMAEARLRDSESKYRSIFEATGNPYFLADMSNGQILDVNEAACLQYGYTREELITLTHKDLTFEPEKTQQTFDEKLTHVPLRYHKHKSGKVFPVEVHLSFYNWQGKDVVLASVLDITDRVEAEQALRESEFKYRNIFEATGSPYFLLDRHTGEVLDVNEAGCRQYGYTREEMLCLRHIDLSAEPEKTLDSVVNGHEKVDFRYHRRKNGELFPVEIINSFYNWQGRDVILTSLRDISERVDAEKALKKSEARYRGIVESQRDVVLGVDLNGLPIYANEAWTRVTGVPISSPDEGKNVQVIHPEDLPRFAEHVVALQQPPHRQYVELRIKTMEGWRWYGFESCHILNEHGQPADGVTVGRDIHNYKLAEEQLQAHARRLGLATEAAMEGVWEHNLVTHNIYLSPQTYALLGYPPEEYGTVRPDNTVLQDDFASIAETVTNYLQGKTDRIDCEYRVITKSGEIRWVQCRGRVTERSEDGTPTAIGGTITDITDARKAREALKKAHTDLQKAYCTQKEFLNCVTHEIRTPLIAVKGYVDMLLEGFAGPINEKQQCYLRKIQTSSDTLLSGVSAMLEMSRIKSGKVEISYEIFAPMKLVSRVVSVMVPHAHQKGLSLQVNDCGCPCAGVTDATKVTVILNNLLANAVKFTDSGGVEAFVESDDSGFTVSVVDTGKGMCDSDVELIFEEFEQLKTSVKYKETGFGIGLALVANLVEVLGAELVVSTVKGLGSAFTLRVPRLDPSAAAELGKG